MRRPYILISIFLLFCWSCKKSPNVINQNQSAVKAPVLADNNALYTWGDEVPITPDSTFTGTTSNTSIIINNNIVVHPSRISNNIIYFNVPNTVPYQTNGLVVSVNGQKSNVIALELHTPTITAGGSLDLIYGSTLTIPGQYFNPVAANNRVTLGSLNLKIVSATPTQLVVKYDSTAMSTAGWIYVYTGQAGLSITNAINYNYYRFLQPAGSFPGTPRLGGAMVTINNIIYFGLGLSATNGKPMYDWWKYDPANAGWTAAATSSNDGGSYMTSFVIGNKAYFLSDGYFYSYDSSSNTWNQLNNFPGGIINSSTGFSSAQYGYIVCGQLQTTVSEQYVNTVWRYDAANNTWTQLNNFPGMVRAMAGGITLNNNAYMIGGTSTTDYLQEVWSFDLVNETWTQVASIPTDAGSVEAFIFTADGKICYGGGTTGTNSVVGLTSSKVYEYDPGANTWTLKEMMLDKIQSSEAAVGVNNIGYIVGGLGASAANPQGVQYFFKFIQ